MADAVVDLLNDAARNCGDPGMQYVTLSDWTSYYNSVTRSMCTKYKVLEGVSTFDVDSDSEDYQWPEDMVKIRRLEWNPDPVNDPDGWREICEKPEWWIRQYTWGRMPTGDPLWYWARQGWFTVVPRPALDIAGGGRISFWKVPIKIEDGQEAQPFELPITVRDLVVDGMTVRGKRKRQLYEEAAAEEGAYLRSLGESLDAIEDRADDGPEFLRPRSFDHPFGGMR